MYPTKALLKYGEKQRDGGNTKHDWTGRKQRKTERIAGRRKESESCVTVKKFPDSAQAIS